MKGLEKDLLGGLGGDEFGASLGMMSGRKGRYISLDPCCGSPVIEGRVSGRRSRTKRSTIADARARAQKIPLQPNASAITPEKAGPIAGAAWPIVKRPNIPALSCGSVISANNPAPIGYVLALHA